MTIGTTPEPTAFPSPEEGNPATFFAPPERAVQEALSDLARTAVSDPIVQIVLEAVSGYLLLLDDHRQIIAGNDEVIHALGIRQSADMLGYRPGELFHCENAHLGPGGCGTSQKCRRCGAVQTILACQSSREVAEGECSITMEIDGELRATEFHVRCTPLVLAGQPVTAIVLQDISASKRRDVLERIFMHDLRNVLQGLIGYSEVITSGESNVASRMILALSNQLNEEIDGQDCLMRAERGELDVNYDMLDARDILEAVRVVFEQHPASRGKTLRLLCESAETTLISDQRLVRRVLINMVKNAFEAIHTGATVKLRFERVDGDPIFTVWNPGRIAESVASQIFKRSFSTHQAAGRGLGTYSMRLLGNQYLGGSVDFSTSEQDGTEFHLRLSGNIPVTPMVS